MQSFTTQSHTRNYQGNVVLPATRAPKKGRKMMGFATSVMALAVAVMGGLWGATAVHNYQLKQQVATVSTVATQNDTVAIDTEKEDPIVYPAMTLEEYPDEPVNNEKEKHHTSPLHKKRPLRALMVEEQASESNYQAKVIHNS